jgi:hypothetical protein
MEHGEVLHRVLHPNNAHGKGKRKKGKKEKRKKELGGLCYYSQKCSRCAEQECGVGQSRNQPRDKEQPKLMQALSERNGMMYVRKVQF